MALFQYQALDSTGSLVSGHAKANAKKHLIEQLERQGLELINIKRCLVFKSLNLTLSLQIQFLTQLAQMTEAGVPILQALSDIYDSEDSKPHADLLNNVVQQVSSGISFSQSLEYSQVGFSSVILAIIRCGENTGRLDKSLWQAREILVWQQSVSSRIQKAVFYPLLSGCVLTLVSMFLLTYLVPQLTAFIEATGFDLPWYTLWLIQLSTHLVKYGLLYICFLLGISVLGYLLTQFNARFSHTINFLLLRLYWIGPILLHIKVARFAYLTSQMYQAGLTVLVALEASKKVCANPALESVLNRVIEQIQEGQGIGVSFRKAGLFPPFVARMISVGESSGSLDKALLFVSDHFKQEADKSIGRFEQCIGPLITLSVGFLLIWLIVAVIGPVYDSVLDLGLQT